MSSFDCVVRGATVVTPMGADRLDVGITDGRVAELGVDLAGGREEIAAADLHVLPGAIDVHVHANDPGRTVWEGAAYASSGLVAGGTTTAFDMPLNAHPPTVDLAAWEAKRKVWQARARVDYAFWAGIVPGKGDELAALAEAGAIGFKAFMVDSGTDDFPAANDATLYAGMQTAASFGLPVAVHAENAALIAAGARALAATTDRGARSYLASRPLIAELEAVSRALVLAGEAGCKVHLVHLSSSRSVRLVTEARARGVDASCETCAHYLLFDIEDAERIGILAKCAPPLRERAEREGLWEALRGGEIDLVSSDHSPAPPELKDGDFLTAWGGIMGGQLLSAVMISAGYHTRGLALEHIAARLGEVPARRFGLSGKGRVAVGADADLALVDLAGSLDVGETTLRHRYPALTPYIGQHLRGRVVRTLLRGATVALEGRPVGEPRGRFVAPARAAHVVDAGASLARGT